MTSPLPASLLTHDPHLGAGALTRPRASVRLRARGHSQATCRVCQAGRDSRTSTNTKPLQPLLDGSFSRDRPQGPGKAFAGQESSHAHSLMSSTQQSAAGGVAGIGEWPNPRSGAVDSGTRRGEPASLRNVNSLNPRPGCAARQDLPARCARWGRHKRVGPQI